MAGITVEQAQAQLDLWLAASSAVSKKQRYKIGDREMFFSDAAEIRGNITYWNDMVIKLSARASGRGRSRTIIPAR